jgi:hypothetical protein
MNQKTNENQEVEKRKIFNRIGEAISKAFFAWLCQFEIGMSPHESQMFVHHYGYGCEEAAYYQYLAAYKIEEDKTS